VIRATLLADGSSDRVLLPIVRWVMRQATTDTFELEWADLRIVSSGLRRLDEKVAATLDAYPCEFLFVHRDAENQEPEQRYEEIRKATQGSGATCVPLVPVRMQEAWLLHDEAALRRAVGRPSGCEDLALPEFAKVERIADPKQVLHDAIRAASEATGRRARKLQPSKVAHLLADQILDWSPLRRLPAFRRFEEDTRRVLGGRVPA